MSFKTFFNWSTGKDSALALYDMLQDSSFSVDQLLTTVSAETNRVSMHGVRKELLKEQARQIGIPLSILEIPDGITMHNYDQTMKAALVDKKKQEFTHAGFGDIFLEDLKTYRITKLKSVGLQAHFPLWGMNTAELMDKFIGLGFKAISVAVNAKLLDQTMVGRTIDKEFLKMLPKGVDPCGENGEFHTFVYDGPIFKKPIDFVIGEKIQVNYGQAESTTTKEESWDTSFWFCDLHLK